MCSTLEHRNARGAKVLWEKFESGEEADTEIQQQRNHAVTIVQEVLNPRNENYPTLDWQ